MEALMLSLADYRDILQIRRDFAVLRAEWRLCFATTMPANSTGFSLGNRAAPEAASGQMMMPALQPPKIPTTR
jgi:hypothetical protein